MQYRLLCQSLEHLLSLKEIIEQYKLKHNQDEESITNNSSISQLLLVLIQRLQTVLKHLVIIAKKG